MVQQVRLLGGRAAAGQSLILAAKARAVLHGRLHAGIADIRHVARPVLRHRIVTTFHAEAEGIGPDQIIDQADRGSSRRERAGGRSTLIWDQIGARSSACGFGLAILRIGTWRNEERAAVAEARSERLDPTALARFGRLELLARLVVEGVMSGLHKSPFKGFSVEFAEHRQYGPGRRDPPYRLAGVRQDRPLLRQGIRGRDEPEGDHRRRFVGQHGLRGPDGLEARARPAAGGVAGVPDDRPARRGRAGHVRHGGALDDSAAVGARAISRSSARASKPPRPAARSRSAGILHALAERIHRRGLVIILSDGFDELDDLISALKHLRHRHHEVLFFHILAPEEEEFPFRRPMQLRNLERPEHDLRVDPLALRAAYLERFNAVLPRA